MRDNIDKLRDGQHVVVGTPDRVFDMLSKRHLRIDELLTFVCDETDFEDPVSNGEYSGTCVSTAPVAEPTVMLFTVPLSDSIIAATATAVTTCLSSADCSDSAAPMCSVNVCVAMSCCGGSFSPDGAYDSLWDSVKLMKGKYTINCFQYQEDVEYVCVLNDWISSNDEICADNYNYFRFKLKSNGRSEF